MSKKTAIDQGETPSRTQPAPGRFVQEPKANAEQRLIKLEHQLAVIKRLHEQSIDQLANDARKAEHANKKERFCSMLERRRPFKFFLAAIKKLGLSSRKIHNNSQKKGRPKQAGEPNPDRSNLPMDVKRKTEKIEELAAYAQENIELITKKLKLLDAKPDCAIDNINNLHRKLFDFGFTERAYEDLLQIAHDQANYERFDAAKELAQWEIDKYTKDGAQRALKFLGIVKEQPLDSDMSRQTSIMEAECYQRVGKAGHAAQIIQEELEALPHVDLFLARANLEDNPDAKLEWINKALAMCNVEPIHVQKKNNVYLYERLKADAELSGTPKYEQPLVSIIMPADNAGGTIQTALDSLLNQTWSNLEILVVVDDCSTDNTVDVVRKYEKKYENVTLLQAPPNSGPYVARNVALQQAKGEFITTNDPDEWSHPEKVEQQAQQLLENPDVIGNISQQIRATKSLFLYRRDTYGRSAFGNYSSLMFRHHPIMQTIGYFDSVRFGADTEFIHRIKKMHGDKSIAELDSAPLSFRRQPKDTPGVDDYLDYRAYIANARRVYYETYKHYHKTARTLKYEYPQKQRPFPVPELMLPKRDGLKSKARHFDVILASDFRLDGGSNMSNVEEVKAQKQLGLRTGLLQMNRYDFNPQKDISSQIREQVDGGNVQMVVYGEDVSCDVLLLRYPPVLQDFQKFIPDVKANQVCVLMNGTPRSNYDEGGVIRYNIQQSQTNLEKYFGEAGQHATWYPIGPLVRQALYDNHPKDLEHIALSDEDWVNIINVEEWKRPAAPFNTKCPIIGRHSRDHWHKWPDNPEEILAAYPDSNDCEVHILGGGETPTSILGYTPENWTIHEFRSMPPKQFLDGLDVFVYYTHSGWVEAFGRVIIEAMATGVPVILPRQFKTLFGNAALYADATEVKCKIDELMKDKEYYQSRVNAARGYVENNYGYRCHKQRLGQFIKEESFY